MFMRKSGNVRGATVRPPEKLASHRKHLIAVGVLSALVAATTILTPSGDVAANREDRNDIELTLDADILKPIVVGSAAAQQATGAAEATAEPEPALAAVPAQPDWHEETVRRGDNLSLIFKRAGFGSSDVHQVVNEAPEGKALSRIYPGQTIAFLTAEDGSLQAVRHVISPLESVTYQRGSAGFETAREIRQTDIQETWVSAEITSSLFMAGQDAGLSSGLIIELANIFGGVIDFVQDPRKGDTFHVIYEEVLLDGEKYQDGAILAASFTNRGKTYNAFRFEDGDGHVAYYNEDGVSMRKAFLLAPVDFTRISSNFNPRRLHPIYKTTRPHRGTDYAAPTGTPVYAAGDGKVIKSGFTRANGNYLFLQHGDRYVTRYLHLHQRKVKQGQRVTQGQVIGSVGSTGAATGPHLHYEFLIDGQHRDPRKVHRELPKAKTLAAAELPAFRSAIADASQQLAGLQEDRRLAMRSNDHSPSPAP
jgi:murein DD-endopeptidase MepM/ murein hydrolase activator NlpD